MDQKPLAWSINYACSVLNNAIVWLHGAESRLSFITHRETKSLSRDSAASPSYPPNESLQAAVLGGDLGGLGVDTAELSSLAVGEGVHGIEGDVEASSGVVDGKDVDGLALVLELPASAARGGVPASDGLGATDVRELGHVALSLPAVAGDETVSTVGAGDGGQGAATVVIAGVVGD